MADRGWSGPEGFGSGSAADGRADSGAGQTAGLGGAGDAGTFRAGSSPGPVGGRSYLMATAAAGSGDLIGATPGEVATEPGQVRCPFLRSVGPDGTLGEPMTTAVANHRCAAFGDPLPLSLRQQELVCLQRVHVSCPRYLRGTALVGEAAATQAPATRRTRPGWLWLLAALTVLAAVWILIAGPVLGLLPFGGSSSPTPPVVHVSPSAHESTAPGASATHLATATPAASRTAPAASSIPTPTAAASATWPPGATASRMNLVTACPGQADCYIYVVRGPGDNGSSVADTLEGIARFFGVDVAAIQALNPSLGGGTDITPGQQLKIPPPTR